MELLRVMTVDEVKNLINCSFSYKLDSEMVQLRDCVDRVCSKYVIAGCNIPEFRSSTVDGFPVDSKGTAGASDAMPAIMDLIGEVSMGCAAPGEISSPGECFYVPTGGMLPKGSDSVVMVEYTEKMDHRTVLINSPSAVGDNVIQVGEDIRISETVTKAGVRLRPYEIGVLASLGITEVPVYRKPRVAVISTGDEIVSPDSRPEFGQVRDINTYLLYACLQQDGAEPVSFGIIKDDFKELKTVVDMALKECDIVLISGGSSVGKKDQTLKVIASCSGGQVLVHGIAVKPGKPTIVGKVEEKIVFGLPGHPLAASIIYKILVKDYMNKLMSCREEGFGVSAVMRMNYHKAKGREEYLPVSLEYIGGKTAARPVLGKSGLITAFSKAYGYIKIEKNVEGLIEGQTVQVFRL